MSVQNLNLREIEKRFFSHKVDSIYLCIVGKELEQTCAGILFNCISRLIMVNINYVHEV